MVPMHTDDKFLNFFLLFFFSSLLTLTLSQILSLLLGLKFVDRDSLFLSPQGCAEMFRIADAGAFTFPSYQKMGKK